MSQKVPFNLVKSVLWQHLIKFCFYYTFMGVTWCTQNFLLGHPADMVKRHKGPSPNNINGTQFRPYRPFATSSLHFLAHFFVFLRLLLLLRVTGPWFFVFRWAFVFLCGSERWCWWFFFLSPFGCWSSCCFEVSDPLASSCHLFVVCFCFLVFTVVVGVIRLVA